MLQCPECHAYRAYESNDLLISPVQVSLHFHNIIRNSHPSPSPAAVPNQFNKTIIRQLTNMSLTVVKIHLLAQVPIYFSSAMASRANLHYRLLLSWAHPNLRTPPAPSKATPSFTSPTPTALTHTTSTHSPCPWLDPDPDNADKDDLDMDPVSDPMDPNSGSSGRCSSSGGGGPEGPQPFSMRRALPWQRSLLTAPGPCVLFASPGMLNAGVSLQAFVAWAGDPKNLLLLPGFQVAGM